MSPDPATTPSDPPDPGDLATAMRGLQVFAGVIVSSVTTARTRSGVTSSQVRALALLCIRDAGTATDVARDQGVTLPTAKRMCDRLVGAGLVSRVRSETDRRRVELRPTDRGRQVVERIVQDRRRELDALLRRMSTGDRAALVRGLGALADVAGEQSHVFVR